MSGSTVGATRLALVATSHHLAPVELRERLWVARHETGAVARRLAAQGEAVVLSTCNRTEIYLSDTDPAAARARAAAELARRAGVGPVELEPALRRAEGEDVVRHLFRVAAGLESLVVGEPQILGQVRQAHALARQSGAAGALLDRLFAHALRAGKRVRAETALAEGSASIAAAAADVARDVFGALAGRRLLIIGAGKMSELAAASLFSGGMEKVFIANRTLEAAERLAARFGGRAIAFDRLVHELARADVVVSSTACPGFVVTAADVARALPRRRRSPLLLIDIAVPRDLDPAIRALDGCRLFDVDDLGAAARERGAPREPDVERAQTILYEEAERFLAWQRSLDVVPALTSLRRRAEAIRAAELARASGKLRSLSPAQQRALEALTAQIVNKLLHTPTVRVKQAAGSGEEGRAYASALQHLFALEELR